MMAREASLALGVGMRASFSEYYTPDDSEYERFVSEGMIVLDANVLLTPYRVDAETRVQVFSVLEELKERIWIPYQAGWEFFKNRPNVLGGEDKVYADLEKPLKQALQSIEAHMKTLKGHPVVTDQEQSRITRHLEDAIALVARLGEGRDEKLEDALRLDSILSRWESILEGRVGEAPSGVIREGWIKEAEVRYEAEVPPGYKDASKPLANRYGDALLWLELLEHLKSHREGGPDRVLLVTNDAKEDWYREQSGRTIGPRVELVKEMESVGVKYYQQRLSGFLRRSAQFLAKEVSPEAIQQVTRSSLGDYVQYEAAVISALQEAFPGMADTRHSVSAKGEILPDAIIETSNGPFGVEVKMVQVIGLKELTQLRGLAEISGLSGLLVVTPTGQVSSVVKNYLMREKGYGEPLIVMRTWDPEQGPEGLVSSVRDFQHRIQKRRMVNWEKP
ncbi:PIN-like domain-containing protein [Streptomyces sp. NPDC047981]|uniref:PIN-like domain-containing protein n=1 Tax=Streptomyces sp. NPDC047981 TaxID=3154610 RepID=UPI00342429E8